MPADGMPRYCFALNCDERIPHSMLMCRRHWFLVPCALQREVYGALRDRVALKGSAPYEIAIRRAAIAVAYKERMDQFNRVAIAELYTQIHAIEKQLAEKEAGHAAFATE